MTRSIIRSFFLVQAVLISLIIRGQKPRGAVTHHRGSFNGQALNYSAIVDEDFIYPDKAISPAVSLITTSYIKENSASTNRPIVFIFNGGPGASSSPLHMNALGPWRIKQGKDSAVLVENTYSLLDLADLVFIDPPGTGFTRVFLPDVAKHYWDVKGDAQMFIDIIKKWKRANNREASPVFLCGESYGTTRATAMMGLAKDLKISGAILLSSVFDLTIINPAPGNDMPYVLYLPGMAAVAYYHKKADKRITSPEQAYEEGVRFALDEYIAALAKGVSLTAKEKEKIAAKLSGLIGLSKEIILEKDLRITPKDFQLLLLAKEQKRVGQLNGQITGPLHNPGAKPPFDDPSMSMGPSTRGIVGRYFKQTLLFPDTGTYRTLNLDVNSAWNWSSMEEDLGYLTVAGYLPKILKEQPHLNLLVAGGYYDLATPIYAARYILEHVGVKADRVTYANFPTGHSIFEKEEELKKLTDRVRVFIEVQKKK
jgi:carboxypeptidase C (cathepsin A)